MIYAKLWNFSAVFEIIEKENKSECVVNIKLFFLRLKPHFQVEFKENDYEIEKINVKFSHCADFSYFTCQLGEKKYFDILAYSRVVLSLRNIFNLQKILY